jgi:magnesium-transporting ATPase (P-type)
MRVVGLWTPAARDWTSPGDEPDADALELLRAGVLCSDGADEAADPTEAALLGGAIEGGVEPAPLRAALPRIDAIPFDGARKFMLTLHRDVAHGVVAYLKGAPEAVLARCGAPAAAHAAVDAMAEQGMRVLALARRRAGASVETAEEALDGTWELLGLEAMVDPPREDALAAVAACRAAGIDVKMITGDHLATARAIGARFGLDGAGLSGADLDALDDDAFAAAARDVGVFARVAPEHKLRLVEALERHGEVVAMTGDGVNDAPALRQADIGVAMGAGGTATAREAADVVLTDDDFASIAAAVEEGRRVYDNIQKAIAFVLPTNLGEALVILIAVLLFPFSGGEPLLPVHPTQILWVNLIATVTLALPLAVEAQEPALMRRRPRAPGEALLSRPLLIRTVAAALLMTAVALVVFALERHAELAAGASPDDALATGQTAAVTAIVLFQAVYLLECRSLRTSLFRMSPGGNPWVWAGIGSVLLLQCAFIYAPPLQDLFGSAALDASSWALAGGAAFSVLPLVEAEKRLRRRCP